MPTILRAWVERDTPHDAFRLSVFELLVFVVPLALLLLAGALHFRLLDYATAPALNPAEAEHRIQVVADVEYALLESESAVRAFVLTGADAMDRRVVAADRAYLAARETLLRRGHAGPEAARVAAVIALADHRMSFIRRAHDRRRAEDHEAIGQMVRSPEGPRSMDDARDALRALRHEVEARRAQLQAQQDTAEDRRLIAVTATALFSIAAGLTFAALGLRRAMRRLRRIGADRAIALQSLWCRDDD